MTTYEKFEKVREHISDDDLLNHILNWLPDDTMNEILNDAINDNDLDYFFPEEFGEDDEED
jgi:hypothetical protein